LQIYRKNYAKFFYGSFNLIQELKNTLMESSVKFSKGFSFGKRNKYNLKLSNEAKSFMGLISALKTLFLCTVI
jgi:hypothetical protein